MRRQRRRHHVGRDAGDDRTGRGDHRGARDVSGRHDGAAATGCRRQRRQADVQGEADRHVRPAGLGRLAAERRPHLRGRAARGPDHGRRLRHAVPDAARAGLDRQRAGPARASRSIPTSPRTAATSSTTRTPTATRAWSSSTVGRRRRAGARRGSRSTSRTRTTTAATSLFGPDGQAVRRHGRRRLGRRSARTARRTRRRCSASCSRSTSTAATPKPQIAAIGLRNPWRFSFSPDGKQISYRRRRPERVGGDRPRAVPAAGRRELRLAPARGQPRVRRRRRRAEGLHRAGVRVLARRTAAARSRAASSRATCTCSATTARPVLGIQGDKRRRT